MDATAVTPMQADPSPKVSSPWPAAILTASYLIIAIMLSPAYGPTWDHCMGEYIQGERWLAAIVNGHWDVLAAGDQGVSLAQRQPHLASDLSAFYWYQIYPVGSLLSALSCQILWTQLGIMSSLTAHNLVIQVLVAILLFALVRWSERRLGTGPGICAGLLLILSPRFFAHSFNNLKDVPETCFYTLALLAAFLALTGGRRKVYLVTAVLSALALAQKANALFIPVHLVAFLVIDALQRRRRGELGIKLRWSSLSIAALLFTAVYLIVSPPIWVNTWQRLGIQFGEILRVGRSETAEVSLHGVEHFLWTTPPMLLGLALIGLFSKVLDRRTRLFLGLGLLIPLGRTMLPGMRNFDGVRHFLEFYPFLCILGAAGVAQLLGICSRHRLAHPLLYATVILIPGLATVQGHPNSLCYFNSFIGGLRGAQQAEVEQATDYWANSYWQGLDWINTEAERDAALMVPIADQVVASSAPIKLRSDIELCDASQPPKQGPLYVMYVTRRERYLSYLEEIDRGMSPVHEITAYGAPILRILKIDDPVLIAETWSAWQKAKRLAGYAPLSEIFAWIGGRPERSEALLTILLAANGESAEATIHKLKAVLPERLHDELPDQLRFLLAFVRQEGGWRDKGR